MCSEFGVELRFNVLLSDALPAWWVDEITAEVSSWVVITVTN